MGSPITCRVSVLLPLVGSTSRTSSPNAQLIRSARVGSPEPPSPSRLSVSEVLEAPNELALPLVRSTMAVGLAPMYVYTVREPGAGSPEAAPPSRTSYPSVTSDQKLLADCLKKPLFGSTAALVF